MRSEMYKMPLHPWPQPSSTGELMALHKRCQYCY